MNELTTDEMDGLLKALSQKPLTKQETCKIPLRAPGSYGKINKVTFSPLDGERPPPLDLTEKELKNFETLQVNVEVLFGKTKMRLRELAALKEGSLLAFEDFCDDLVEIHVNGVCVGKGEVVSVDGQFGVKILSFKKALGT